MAPERAASQPRDARDVPPARPEPTPNLVPWAGEFVGKYLISAIQALRMTERPELRALVTQTIAELISTQADDGYLGPFPREMRLRGNWDLWGHYHVMLALLMWHEMTGDPDALKACQRAADLVARPFWMASCSVFDAGSPEMNMAIIHSLGRLYRTDPRGPLPPDDARNRKGLGTRGRLPPDRPERPGVFQTPRPRWESLHDLQGLLELYRITGNEEDRPPSPIIGEASLRWDRRNTGGFSSGEQATGNPYAPTAIETCCTVAWMALTIDMLQWTARRECADELEFSLLTQPWARNIPLAAGAPTTRPWTAFAKPPAYHRLSSARGTPELNCCSVTCSRAAGGAAFGMGGTFRRDAPSW